MTWGFFILCVREFCDLRCSRLKALACRTAVGAAGIMARPLDGFLFGELGDPDHGLSRRLFESAASMSIRPRNRLER
jgi:hypothetical protein